VCCAAPQYAHGVDVLSKGADAAEKLFHINGNAIYDFHSEGFRQYLRGAAGTVPNSFDYSLFKHRHQMNAAGYQFVTQQTLSRFQYSNIILNNAVDLCQPSLGAFLRARPNTYLVHGKGAYVSCDVCTKSHGVVQSACVAHLRLQYPVLCMIQQPTAIVGRCGESKSRHLVL